jgi:hypothetical protein
MTSARFIGATAAVLVHLPLLLSLQMSRPDATEAVDVEAIASRGDSDDAIHPLPVSDWSGYGEPCQNSYRGVGARTAKHGPTVIHVVPGGPAEKAGLREGDEFLNESMFVRDGYSLGRLMVLRISRDGQRLDLPVTIGRICFAEDGHIP